ncbi:hypothetical protein HQQ92_22985 [Shewanella sp. DC2-4]|uniref:hypothetical protein n=1 Tax=Shewanella sp. DC2-4 TaxID=2739431 RepID=UPI0015638984|nr:hypothetical protein [Shewanella sp. DC2-4]NRD34583.1 hypothetical protein [Shewanella sp. DC2-4]
MGLAIKITNMIASVNNLMGVIDGKLRNKANAVDVYPKTHIDDPLKTLGANAATASKLKISRQIALSGDATGAAAFNGAENITLVVTVAALADKADKVDTLTPAQVDARIQAIVGAAPVALDTLTELAEALGNDPDFAATMTAELGKKANITTVYTMTAADARFLLKGEKAADSALLGGNNPAFYAPKSGLEALETEVGDALSQLTTAFTNGANQINNIGA